MLSVAPKEITINTSSSNPLKPMFTDFVNCSARGYPPPTVRWVPLTAGATNPQYNKYGPGWAILSFANPQIQTWNCTAYNGQGWQINQTYTFSGKSPPLGFLVWDPPCLRVGARPKAKN